jgi:hypothetical protein
MRLLKFCGSLRLAIVLMVVLVGVLIPATCLENSSGPAAARFFIYGTGWFAALGVLLAVNVLAALVLRFPWKRRQTGFVLTHVGLLVLLLGCLLTRRFGIDAVLPIFEGQAARIAREDSRHFELTPATAAAAAVCVPFDPGPLGWDAYPRLLGFWRDQGVLYDRDGIRLEALDYRGDGQPAGSPASRRSAVSSQPQVRVRLTVDGAAEEFWIAPTPSEPFDSPPKNVRKVVAGQGRKVALTLRSDEVDLGVEVFLHKFRRKLEPGSSQAAYYSSLIDLRDREDDHRSLRSNVLLTLNAPVDFADPATGRSYRLFQSNFVGPLEAADLDIPWTGPADPPPRIYLSVLTVNHDPGRWCKYLGCLLIVGGIFCNYFLKSLFGKGSSNNNSPLPFVGEGTGVRGIAATSAVAMGKSGAPTIFIAALLALGPAARAEDAAGLDWGPWQRLPVLDGGRIMPLDTFARGTVEKISGGRGPRLAPSGAAAEVLLSWLVEPERWEEVSFLPAADPALRELLDVPLRDEAGRPLRSVSPRQVLRAAKRLARGDKQAEDLLEAYTSYRMLTFHPAAARDGRGRFLEKLVDLTRDWSDLEDTLERFFPPREHAAANPTAETAAGLDKLIALARQAEEPPLAEFEGAAASLERSTAAVAGQTAALLERMVRSPPPLPAERLRPLRMILRGVASRTEDLARRAAAAHLALYDNGLALRLAPALDAAALEEDRESGDDAQPWASLQTLIHGSDDLLRAYPQRPLHELRRAYRQLAAAYRQRGDPQRAQRFRDAVGAFAAALQTLGQAVEPIRRRLPIRQRDEDLLAATAYPPPGATDAEVFYNRADPFYWSWVAAAMAAVCLAISLAVLRRAIFRLGMAALGASQVLIVAGLAWRARITGFTPAATMFETIVLVSLCLGLMGMGVTLWLARRGRGTACATAGSSSSAEDTVGQANRGTPGTAQAYAPPAVALTTASLGLLALLVAYYSPLFPKDIRPLMPVLRSNVWLAVHVLSILAGYGAALLGCALGCIALGFYFFGRYRQGREPEACAFLAPLIYKVIQIALLLLCVGTILGALWADVSWGRFWGWDPKEVWALISLLAYLVILHGRSIGGAPACGSGNFTMALTSVLGFSFIVMTYFVSGGKHSYGEGAGGPWGAWTILALAMLVLWLAAAVWYLSPARRGK